VARSHEPAHNELYFAGTQELIHFRTLTQCLNVNQFSIGIMADNKNEQTSIDLISVAEAQPDKAQPGEAAPRGSDSCPVILLVDDEDNPVSLTVDSYGISHADR